MQMNVGVCTYGMTGFSYKISTRELSFSSFSALIMKNMEKWEAILGQKLDLNNLKILKNVIYTAQAMLTEDLAPFEIDWFLESLLIKPVALLETVSHHQDDDAWAKLLINSFTLLTGIVDKYLNAESYYEDIERLCNLPYPALVKAKALSCLSQLARRHSLRESSVRAQERDLELDNTCIAPRCQLLGVLCEHHPELFPDVTTLWRTLINMLDSHIRNAKMSLNVVKEVLSAVSRLFKNFGTDLVVSEVYAFYEKMNVFINVPKCHEVCCSILESYSDLFKEKISADTKLRLYLWDSLSKTSRPAVIAVYRTCFVNGDNLQDIIKELVIKSSTDRPLTKFTALRILSEAQRGGHVTFDVRCHADVQRLERSLRDGSAHDDLEAISWCIRTDVLNSDRLLQTAILFYDALPTTARYEIVVQIILEANAEIRTPAIIFLIKETCTASDGAQRGMFMSIWKGLLDSCGGVDVIVLERSRHVLEDYLRHATFLLETSLDDEVDELSPKLSALLNLTAYVLDTQDAGGVTNSAFARMVLLYARTYVCAATMRVVRAAAGRGVDIGAFYKCIDISGCDEEDLLLQSCRVLLDAPADAVDCGELLLAAKVLLSRSDTEPAVLSKVLKSLEYLILNREKELHKQLLYEVIYLIERTRELYVGGSRDQRILHRDAVMFLSKFGSNERRNKVQSCEKVLTTSLDELYLNIPSEGSTMKLDLSGVLEHAVAAEDPEVLNTLVTVIYANTRDPASPATNAALCRAIAALSRRSPLAARAAPLCGYSGAHRLLAYAVNDNWPQARAVLLAATGALLARGTQRQAAHLMDDVVTRAAAQRNTSQTKLDLLAMAITAMNDNNILAQKYLPTVLILILQTQLSATGKVFSDACLLLIDKISLFDDKEVESVTYGVVDCLGGVDCVMDTKAKKIMVKAVNFLKKLYGLKREQLPDLIDVFERVARGSNSRVLHALSDLKNVFEFDLPLCRKIIARVSTFFEKFFDLTLEPDAILYFVSAFSDILLEVHYERTLKKLSQLIEDITPEQIIYARKHLSMCLDAVRRCLKSIPQVLCRSLVTWLHGHAVSRITHSLAASQEVDCAIVAEALTSIVDIFEVATTSQYIRPLASDWLRQIRSIAHDDLSDRDARCLSSLVQVCLVVLPSESVQGIVCGEDNEGTLMFCRTYISAFSKFFTRKPFILLKENWSDLVVILNDAVQYTVTRRREELQSVLELVNELWPSYETKSDLKQKYSLLLELSCHRSKLSPESNPMQWVVRTLAGASTSGEDKIRLIALVPGGEAYSSTYATFASAWPARLSEMRAQAACALRALLDNCAHTRDHALLALLASLAAGDSTKGWWDEAFDDCMKEVAVDAKMNLLEHVYRVSWGGRTMGACERLLIPLLRYIPSSVCEEFFSIFLEQLLAVMKKEPREGASSAVRHNCVTDYICAFNVLTIAFEKIPKQHIESPGSVLYSRAKAECVRPYQLVRDVCVRGAQLRVGWCADGAAGAGGDMYRVFHCAAYNCMAAALCCRSPQPKFYGAVFDASVWRSLVDEHVEYSLPITESWKQHTTRQAVSIDISAGEQSSLSVGTPSRTVHFLRTLSEDPFLYDIPELETPSTSQEIQLLVNPLNKHECAATLTALFCHAATLDGLEWLDTLCSALDRDLQVPNKNVRWLLAQVICNCKAELKPHAAALRPKLLALVADAAATSLNGLHVEILNTVIYWREEVVTDIDRDHLNSIVQLLVGTAKCHASQRGLVVTLLDKLDKILNMYGSWVTVAKECCYASSSGFYDSDNQLGLKILKIFAKNKVDLKVVLVELLTAHHIVDASSAASVGKALGLAVGTQTSQMAAQFAMQLQQMAERLRRDGNLQQYLKLVYYMQKEWPGCCDITMARHIADLANKIPGSVKQKCLEIIATYLEHASPGKHIDALFDTLDISQLLAAGQGQTVVEKGLPLMQESLRRRVTLQLVDGACATSSLLLTALEVAISSRTPNEPQSKKRRMDSAILSEELRPVVSSVSNALTDADVGRVAAVLTSDHAMRFCQAFALALYYPVMSQRNDLTECAYRTLELFLQRVRSQDSFQSLRLREEPLDLDSGTQQHAAQSTSTKPSAQGPVQSRLPVADAPCDLALDVRVPLDDVLGSVLQFAKRHSSVASELCMQVSRAWRSAAADEAICVLLLQLVRRHATPLVLQLCRLHVDGCCALQGFPEAVQELVLSARGSEHYRLALTLQQEVRLRCAGPRLFVMGSAVHNEDTEMPQVKNQFSINDLVARFNTLAHWDELTARQRAAASRRLPVLWTDSDTFQSSLELYEGEDWFGAMLAVYRDTERGHGCSRRLSELDRWPRNNFDVAAVAEAVEWRCIRDESRSETDLCKLTSRIEKENCLAKWAARLMLRRLFFKTVEVESDTQSSDKDRTLMRALSLSHQLQWCRRANEMALPAAALQCLEDVSGLYESETLQWMVQKMVALRTLGLQRGDRERLREALDMYELAAQFRGASSTEAVLAVEHCRLLLLADMRTISPDNISAVCDELKNHERLGGLELSDEFRSTLNSMFSIVMSCLYDSCANDLSLLVEMCNILRVYVGLAIGPKATAFADMIIQRVGERGANTLPPDAATTVLGALNAMRDDLDEIALELIRKYKHLFPNAASYEELFLVDESLVQSKLMLSLVADPSYCLLQYCRELLRAAKACDNVSWAQSFARMKAKMFENPHAGPDYRVLAQYRLPLYDMEQYDEKSMTTRREALEQLVAELRCPERRTLSLPQLCPALCDGTQSRDRALRTLLRLPADAPVQFDETVHVYTESIRRAAVLTVGGAGGVRVRRYIVKSGETLRCDAAARRVHCALVGGGGYWVTTLSEDCGLVEFLEEHDTVRSLIVKSSGADVAGVAGVSSTVDPIQNRAVAEEQFEKNCSKVPANLLSRAIEQNCLSVDDFLCKKWTLTRSLSDVTVVNWLLGVGDRHLENLLYSYRDGALCNIDWGAVGQYGRVELPCARLTRNILAVCNLQALESELQRTVRAARDARAQLAAVLHVSFGGLDGFAQQMVHARALLDGEALSQQVTKDVLRTSGVRSKERYIELLDVVFQDIESKQNYTVEEQVTCLLRQCTDPRILSVTRSNWEPWL